LLSIISEKIADKWGDMRRLVLSVWWKLLEIMEYFGVDCSTRPQSLQTSRHGRRKCRLGKEGHRKYYACVTSPETNRP